MSARAWWWGEEAGSSPNMLAFRYTAGDSLTALNATSTRASSGTSIDANGIVQTASTNVARDGHYIGGVRTLLLEGQRTNTCLRSALLTNAPWTAVGTAPSAAGSTAPDGVTTSQRVTLGTEGVQGLFQNVNGYGANATLATSFWIKVITQGDGTTLRCVNPADGTGFTVTPGAVGTWTRVSGTFNATAGGSAGVYFERAASATTTAWVVDIWGVQQEVGAFASSYIATTTTAVTRSADVPSFPILLGVQALTMYASLYQPAGEVLSGRFPILSLGFQYDGAGNSFGTSTTAFGLQIQTPTATTIPLSFRSGNGTANGEAGTPTPTGSATGLLEARGTVSSTGALTVGGAIDGGTEATATSAGVTNGTAFSANALYVANGLCVAIRSIKIAVGVKTMDQMRAA